MRKPAPSRYADSRAAALLRFMHKTTSAWTDTCAAEKALRRAGTGHDREILDSLGRARAALQEAYTAYVPGQRRAPRTSRPERVEPLWRCKYCSALVWQGGRRAHLGQVHLIDDKLWTHAELAVHFGPAPPQADLGGDDQEDDDDE